MAQSIPADVPPERTARIRELAIKTFQVLGCGGLARVDFSPSRAKKSSSTR